MKNLILIAMMFLMVGCVPAIAKQDTTLVGKLTIIRKDTCKIRPTKLDIAKVNVLIDKTTMDDSTKAQVKSIVSDIPEDIEKTKELINIFVKKDNEKKELKNTNDILNNWLNALGVVVTFLTFLAVLVQKIRALPAWMSPLHLISKLFGKGRTVTKAGDVDTNNIPIKEGTKADVQSVVVPSGYVVKVEPITKV